MPSLSIELPDLRHSGPLLEILLAPSKPVRDLLNQSGQPALQPTRCIALIDTGASGTVIRSGLAATLNLQPRGSVNIATPSCTAHPCDTFDVAMFFPGHRVGIELLTVIEAPLSGQNIECLIGRDVLKSSIFIYEGYSNRFVLSF